MEPIDLTTTNYLEMQELLDNESDRGAAVLAGSYVENFLGVYLKSKMIDKSLTDKIFSSSGPLSTFDQRINFSQAFGFLSKEQCADLHLIRKIRNHFAHHPKDASFKVSPVRGWIQNLHSSKIEVPMNSGGVFKVDDGRACYLISAGMFVAITSMAMERAG